MKQARVHIIMGFLLFHVFCAIRSRGESPLPWPVVRIAEMKAFTPVIRECEAILLNSFARTACYAQYTYRAPEYVFLLTYLPPSESGYLRSFNGSYGDHMNVFWSRREWQFCDGGGWCVLPIKATDHTNPRTAVGTDGQIVKLPNQKLDIWVDEWRRVPGSTMTPIPGLSITHTQYGLCALAVCGAKLVLPESNVMSLEAYPVNQIDLAKKVVRDRAIGGGL